MQTAGSLELLQQKRLFPLFCTQFLGAFNDSLFKNALIILIAFMIQTTFTNPDTLINLCAALFVIPVFIFSPLAGQVADKFEKSRLIQIIKVAEVFLIALAVLSLYSLSLSLLFITLFLLGTQATFFGPLKYSILPQHLAESELIAGNGLIEMGTFIAILTGTILGGILIIIPRTGTIWVSGVLSVATLMGLISSFYIPKANAAAARLKIEWSPFREASAILKTAHQNHTIFVSIIGISWFWFYGSIFLTQMGNYTKQILGGVGSVTTILLTMFSIGIGFGSVLCDKLSKQKMAMGLVLFGAIGLSVFAIDFSFANSPLPSHPLNLVEFLHYGQNWRVLLDGFLMGMFGGFYQVPLYALMQNLSAPARRSRIVAANNIMNAIFMTLAALLAIVILNLGFSIPQLFLFTGILNAFVGLYLVKGVPQFLSAFLAWIHFRNK